jgi:hypothetical protein
MGNYGRGWDDGHGSQSGESQDRHSDEEAAREGDWDWLDKSPRQKALRQAQGLELGQYAKRKGE